MMGAMVKHKGRLFYLFFLSGFCSLVYQVIWLRLAFAAFGITTQVISVLLSVFMLGLSLGSWATGKWIVSASNRFRISPIFFYGLAEAIIGGGAFAVPALFRTFSSGLLHLGEMNSFGYFAASGVLIAAALLPWCICMGMTFPLMMAYIRRDGEGETGFSFLYSANVAGAMSGAALTAVYLVETFGFSRTLEVAALGNALIAASSFFLGLRDPYIPSQSGATDCSGNAILSKPQGNQRRIFAILFATGLCSMGMEVVWARAFTPITETSIYAFAFLLTTYLLATRLGSRSYRKHLDRDALIEPDRLLVWLAIAAFFPLLMNDPRVYPTAANVFLSLLPFCGLLGYLTPQLVDRYSQGRADLVGSAYSVNVLGCILGPLATGYLLLPWIGVKWSLFLLAAPFVAYAAVYLGRTVGRTRKNRWSAAALGVVLILSLTARTFEEGESGAKEEVRRDSTATVISFGEGMQKRLLVNGVGMTKLTPITKIMAHLPLSMMRQKPESALVICFGMGTTFRSIMSWGIDATAVELVPSVRDAFGYYHADAHQVLSSPHAHVVIDDGRRFLSRSAMRFDLITLDPPPPVEAAGSSLLYSIEFYGLVKSHLKPGGILQQWFPGGEDRILHSVARSLRESFPYVRVYHSVEGWGFHFLASQQPFADEGEDQLLSRMPENARKDLMEWFPDHDIHEILHDIISRQIPLEQILGGADSPLLRDDRPYNEYFIVRRVFGGTLRVF
jgi:spermidine synthase